ncbi:MAG TPA: GFA family protein [Candidatus Binataceae bacterium]|nr:GFA family protein [Candidatus Binataceae bacterium]
MTYKGGCHCGRIAFEVEGDLAEVMDCNCSICAKRGYLHWFVAPDKLRVLTSESALATYTFKSHKLKHHFCPNCGCAPFVRAAEGAAVNVRCLDGVEIAGLKVKPFDGRSL